MKQKINFLVVAIAAIALFPFGNLKAQTTDSKVYSVEEMIAKASTLVGQTVKVTGVAQHVCATSGRKLFLASPDGKKTFRINAGTEIKRFDKAALHQTVTITGVVTESRVYMEDLNKQEAQALAAEKTKKEAEHCTSEAKAQGENVSATPVQRAQVLQAKLKKQIKKGGNNYLSFYTIDNCNDCTISK